MNKYFAAALVNLELFVLIAGVVFPNLNSNVNSATKSDTRASLDMNNSHSHLFNRLMILSTEFGRDVFWPIVIILLFVFGGWIGKKTAAVIVISLLVLIPLGIIAKDLVSRPRPEIPKADFLIAADKDYGYPSGEALIVSACASVAIALFRNTSRKLAVSIILVIEAAVVCISRVYVGGHYPLDVVGGIFLGVGVSLIFVGMEKRIELLIMPLKKILKK